MLGGGAVVVTKLARGIRNNNPGNIRDNDQNKALWLGEVEGGPNDDSAFLVFTDPKYGIRALVVLLRGYQAKHNLYTVRDIISGYAPSNENDTTAYVNAVAKAVGVGPDQRISVDQHMAPLVKAIIRHENAGYAYPDAKIAEGIALA
jgi:hypothetical protein